MMDHIRALLFPPKCAVCRSLLDWYGAAEHGVALCERCRTKWDSERLETCGHCAKAMTECECMPDALKKSRCRVLRKLVYYRHGTREPIQNRLIYRIKETRDRRAVEFLAISLLPALRDILETSGASKEEIVLTWVPRGRSATLLYGTDQARELARALSKLTGVPCIRLIKRRRGRAREQKKLDAKSRRPNATAAFGLTRAARNIPETVILVDDIVTTGESMAACVRLLRTAGARYVTALSVATDDHNR
jgi:ComF family protein